MVRAEDAAELAAGWISPVLVVDGAVAGVWEHAVTGDRLRVTVQPFAPLPAGTRCDVERWAERYHALLGAATLDLTWSTAHT